MLLLVLIFFILVSPGPEWIAGYEIGDCGIRYNKYTPSIAHGIAAEPNEFPWHVALYRMNHNSQYEYICGGTIIDPYAVLTAGHCVFDEETQDINYSRMVVAAGKHNVSWEYRDIREQRFEVISKKIQSSYKGIDNRFQDDIAVLTLNASIKFSSLVMPVCIDWDGLYEPLDEELGTVFGWGYNEYGVLSEKLQVSQMQLRNLCECRNNERKGFTSFLTSDKFCALNRNVSSVESGDSGGGLVYSRDLGDHGVRYYVKGIISGRVRANNEYVIFTNVSDHIFWLNSTVKTIIAEITASKVCGLINFQSSFDEIAGYEGYPWLATIYMKKNDKFFGIRCVGTIIHQRAIITSNWCVHDKRPLYNGVEYKIVVGKGELNMKKDDVTHQRFNIVRIYKHQNYVDWNTRTENDLVILIVDMEIKFSKSVAPICIDWDRKFPVSDTTIGKIVSWDIDGCHCQVMALYKYLDAEECYQALEDPEKYPSHVISEKVCGKYINGTNFEQGSEIGAGYTILKNGTSRHYLQGVVSKGQPPNQEFLIFTDVETNLRWISDVLLIYS